MAAYIHTFSLLSEDGAIAGLAGSTIGWGYSIENESTTLWLVTSTLNSGSFDHGTPDLLFDFPILAPGQTVTVPFNAVTSRAAIANVGPLSAVGICQFRRFCFRLRMVDGRPFCRWQSPIAGANADRVLQRNGRRLFCNRNDRSCRSVVTAAWCYQSIQTPETILYLMMLRPSARSWFLQPGLYKFRQGNIHCPKDNNDKKQIHNNRPSCSNGISPAWTAAGCKCDSQHWSGHHRERQPASEAGGRDWGPPGPERQLWTLYRSRSAG